MKKNKNFENAKNEFAGKIKEAAGKISGNERMVLSGRMQSSKASFKKKMDLGNIVTEVKENIAEKINDIMDGKIGRAHV